MKVINQNPVAEITPLLEELKDDLSFCIPLKLKKIILFSSYARGDYDRDSDVDVLVILDDEDLRSYNPLFSGLELKYFSKYDLLVSIIPVKFSNYFSNSDRLPFYKVIGSEGLILYG